MEGVLNLVIDIGCVFSESWTYTDDAGDPINLTDCAARLHIKEAKNSIETVLELDTTTGEIVLGGTAGTIALGLTATVTADIESGHYVHDLKIIPASGEDDAYILVSGDVHARLTVTS